MSFYSALLLARAAPPPVVTVVALGQLIRELAAIGALKGEDSPACRIKYGPQVDADERPLAVVEYDESGIIGTYQEYPWDRNDTFPSLEVTADALLADGESVYRAHLSLGSAHRDIVAALTREPSEENSTPLCLWEVSFSVEPVLVAGLGSDTNAFVGWMGLSISGPGYFYPWEYKQARTRAEAVEVVRRMADVCRAIWPVPPAVASEAAIAGRRQLAELWLYEDFDLPPDWFWFAAES